MAAAVTSGVVALMLEANRETYDAPPTPNAVKAILEYTALPLYFRGCAIAGSRWPEWRRRRPDGGICRSRADRSAHGG